MQAHVSGRCTRFGTEQHQANAAAGRAGKAEQVGVITAHCPLRCELGWRLLGCGQSPDCGLSAHIVMGKLDASLAYECKCLRDGHGAQKPCPICAALTSCCVYVKGQPQRLVACAVSRRTTARRGAHLRCVRLGDQSRKLHPCRGLKLQASQMLTQVARLSSTCALASNASWLISHVCKAAQDIMCCASTQSPHLVTVQESSLNKDCIAQGSLCGLMCCQYM